MIDTPEEKEIINLKAALAAKLSKVRAETIEECAKKCDDHSSMKWTEYKTTNK